MRRSLVFLQLLQNLLPVRREMTNLKIEKDKLFRRYSVALHGGEKLRFQLVRRKARRDGLRAGGEHCEMHLAALLQKPCHCSSLAELAVVGVRGED